MRKMTTNNDFKTMNTNNYKNCRFFTIAVFAVATLFASCQKDDADPKVVFKNNDGKVITNDTINVQINSEVQVFAEVDYSDSTPEYLRQTDGGHIENLIKGTDYRLKSNGCRTNGNDFEKVIITTHFADSLVHIGSLVKISARVGTEAYGEVVYKVVE